MKALKIYGKKKIPLLAVGLLWLSVLETEFFPIEALAHVKTRFDHMLYDIVLKRDWFKPTRPDTPIGVVDIDEKSIRAEWPWPRTKIAELVQALKQEGVSVVAFDVVFSESDKADNLLADSFKNTDTVLGVVFHNHTPDSSIGELAKSTSLQFSTNLPQTLQIPTMLRAQGNQSELITRARSNGFLTALPDSDGIIRRSPMLIRYDHQIYPSLALETVRRYLLLDHVDVQSTRVGDVEYPERIQLGDRVINTDEWGRVLIPYLGPAHSIPHWSATDILHHRLPKDSLRNSIVFIGTSALGLSDLQPTPMQPLFPGVEIQAHIASGILANYFITEPFWSKGLERVLLIGPGLLSVAIFPLLGPIGVLVFALFLLFGQAAIYLALWWKWHLLISPVIFGSFVVAQTLIYLGYGFFFEDRNKKAIKAQFGQYVPPEYVEMMSENPEAYTMAGKSERLTVLFADIIGFTHIAESRNAEDVRALLNRFFTPMTEIIFKHKGTVDKYVGDLIMAFWGAPISDPNHTQNALLAALEMRQKVEELEKEFQKLGLPPIRIGIGINTGEMFVGDMGSKYRKAYTVLGDSVNLASRIEGLTRNYGVVILVGEEATKEQDRFIFRYVDRVKVKGKSEPVSIYELIGKKS